VDPRIPRVKSRSGRYGEVKILDSTGTQTVCIQSLCGLHYPDFLMGLLYQRYCMAANARLRVKQKNGF
jgi:hypothetical protein